MRELMIKALNSEAVTGDFIQQWAQHLTGVQNRIDSTEGWVIVADALLLASEVLGEADGTG